MKLQRLTRILLVALGLAGLGAYIFGVQGMRTTHQLSTEHQQAIQTLMQASPLRTAATGIHSQLTEPPSANAWEPPTSSQDRLKTLQQQLAKLDQEISSLDGRIASRDKRSDKLLQQQHACRNALAKAHRDLARAAAIGPTDWDAYLERLENTVGDLRLRLDEAQSILIASNG